MAKTMKIGIVSLLLSQWWMPLILLVLIYLVYLYFSRKGTLSKYNVANQKEDEKRIHDITVEIISHLGVGFTHPVYGDLWKPTEDEEEVVEVLLANQSDFNKIAERYFLLMSDSLAGGSELKADLIKYIDDEELIKQIQHLWI